MWGTPDLEWRLHWQGMTRYQSGEWWIRCPSRAGGGIRWSLAAAGGFYGGRCARSGGSPPPLFGVRASLVGPRFLLVAGSVQEALLVTGI